MNELPISFHRKKIPIFAFIISQMRRLNDEWQFPTHWFWPLVNGDNHAYGEPASSPPVGHPATPHHHRTCRHLFIWPTWSGHLSTSSCALCPLQSWPMFHAPSVSHREGPTACTFATCSTRYISVFQNTAHTHSECVWALFWNTDIYQVEHIHTYRCNRTSSMRNRWCMKHWPRLQRT